MKGEYEKQILPYCICQFFYKAKERAMNKKRLMKRATAAAMCSAMAASSILPAFAADVMPKYTIRIP